MDWIQIFTEWQFTNKTLFTEVSSGEVKLLTG